MAKKVCKFSISTIIIFLLIIGSTKANMIIDSTSKHLVDNVAFNLSSRGLGIELSHRFERLKKINFRSNIIYFSFSKPQNIKMDKGSSVSIFPKIESIVFGTLLDYYPFKGKVFRITGGLSYEVVQQYRVSFSSTTGLNLGGLQIASDDFGKINFGIKWNALRPYLGIGLGRNIMKSKIGVGFDMGVSYMGSPKLSLTYEGFLETTTIDEEIKGIEANMKGYSFYPYLSIQLRYNTYPIKK